MRSLLSTGLAFVTLPALAQETAPAAPVSANWIATWWWVIVLVIIIIAALWYWSTRRT